MEPNRFDESPLLDAEELFARCMGNLEFAERLLNKFQGRLDEDIVQLEAALHAQDAETVARIAHRIKGASANVAARSLRQRAATIEQLARGHSLAEIPVELSELRSEQQRFAQYAALPKSLVAGAPDTGHP